MINIQIWASGSGSNAENFIHYFKDHRFINIQSVLTDNINAGVIDRCKRLGVPCIVATPDQRKSTVLLPDLAQRKIDAIVLAGYLKKVAPAIIDAFENRIINIHPALLPKFGGKGMYGVHVHNAVLEAGESITGITIHIVSQEYDEGPILAQEEIKINDGDDLNAIQKKIAALEMEHYPKVVEHYFQKK